MSRIKATALLLVAVGLCTTGRVSVAKLQQEKRSKMPTVQVEMRNVLYHFTDQIAVHILQLHGMLLPTPQASLPVFDDVQSFTLAINSAAITIGTEALSNVMNQHVFAAPDAPIKEVTVTTAGSNIKVQGKLPAQGGIPFETEGTAVATPDGLIRIHTHKIKAAHVSVKGLMDLLGIKIAQLINMQKVPGVRLEGDDLILDPERILPPPHITGRVTEVQIQGDQILQIFGHRPQPEAVHQHSENYMAYRGSQLRFGKLTMSDTDLVLIDMDPQDPFDFYLEHYKEQLVAGYTKTTPTFGLRVFMRDFNKLPHLPAQQHAMPARPQATVQR
jgi:hypothetical protein